MQVGFVNNQVSIVEDSGWLSQSQALKLQQAILTVGTANFICQRAKDYIVFYTVGLTTERYTIFSFDSQDNLITENY